MVFLIFLQQELRNNFKNLGIFVQNIAFFVISCAIFLIISQNSQNHEQFINIAVISLVFSLIFANSGFLQEDFRDGTLEQMLIYLPNLEIYIAAKIVAGWIIFAVPVLVCIFPMMKLVGFENEFAGDFIWLFALASMAINFICAFCASLGLAANRAPLAAVFILPLIVPILLLAISGVNGGEAFYFAAKSLLALVVFCAVVSLFATAKIVKIVSE